jgi:hypothetical protein
MTDQLDFLDKLFDTLKETTDKSTKTIQTLIDQQNALVNTVEKMPVSEIRQEIKDHIFSAHEEREKIVNNLDKLFIKVNDLTTRVKIMIGVVIAAVAISGIVYYVARFTFEKKDYTYIEKKIERKQQQEHLKIKQEVIEAIRKELRKK